jgi:hypothetical protein
MNFSVADVTDGIDQARNYYKMDATGFLLTEFRDSGSATPRIEVYSNGCEATDPMGLLSLSADTGSLTGTWNPPIIPQYGYSYFTPNENLGLQGDTIILRENGNIIDSLSYGTKGITPDPLAGESTARRFDTDTRIYMDKWLRDPSPTWNGQNDVGRIIITPWVVLNAFLFNPIPGCEEEMYVELCLRPLVAHNISGYKIVCNDEYIVPIIPPLNKTDKYFVLTYSDMPAFFDNMDANGDNIYFYDSSDNLFDMVGWNTPHVQGMFVARISDAFGTYQGFNDTSSEAARWVFDIPQKLLLTEFQVDAADSARLEFYNPERGIKILSTRWSIEVDGGPITGSWTPANGKMPSGGYAYIDWGGGANPNPEGDTISLYFQGVLVEEVSYGTKGIAPDPLMGESTARYWNDSLGAKAYIDNWTREVSPSFGARNDVPKNSVFTNITLTEVLFNPMMAPNGRYIVIMNRDQYVSANIRNFTIVCDSAFSLANFGNVVLYPGEIFIVKYDSDPPGTSNLFDGMDPSGDNIYLYDKKGVLRDMVGWNSPHHMDMLLRRVPDGFGNHTGYNDTSSEAAGWVFNCPLEVQITEISDSGSSQAQIEVYNPKYLSVDFQPAFTFETRTGPINGDWGYNPATAGEYVVFNVTTPGGLDLQGDTVTLYQNGYFVEEISYGQMGLVPDPLPDESVQRCFDGKNYTDNWTRNISTGTNFGAQNDVPLPAYRTPMVLNEVFFNPINVNDHFIELYYFNATVIDISGYKLVCNSEYIFPQGTQLTVDHKFSYLLFNEDNLFFQKMDIQGDNVYLYNENGSLVDMFGWSSPHTQDKTACRIPDGFGLRDGYEDISSVLAGWQFDQDPTLQMVKIGPDLEQFAHKNTTVTYVLRLENRHDGDDLIELNIFTSPWGFIVNLYDHNGDPITDSNGNGMPDIYLSAHWQFMIIVNITVLNIDPLTKMERTVITAISTINSIFRDNVTLTTRVYPYIIVNKSVSPKVINILGTGYGEEATITLNASGCGYSILKKLAQDVVFCMDSSWSMAFFDTGAYRKNGAKLYVDSMSLWDRGAVVDFDEYAVLLHNLSTDYEQIKNDIDTIDSWGNTEYGRGLRTSIDELLANGNPEHVWIIILLSDGNGYEDLARAQAGRAAENGIKVFTVGLGENHNEDILKEIANITDGEYYYAKAAVDLLDVFMNISKLFSKTAGEDLNTNDSNPMIRDVLPPWIDYVPGSFSIQPDVIYTDSRGYTFLEWNMSKINLSVTWEVTFDITSVRSGWQLTNEVQTSRVNYTNWNNESITLLFPETWINVIPKEPLPPELYIQVLPDGGGQDIMLNWTPVVQPETSHYLIYRSTSQTGFDFSNVWVNTSQYDDNGIIPFRTTINDTGSASDLAPKEYYYVIRTVMNSGLVSSTSRTVGKWTRTFSSGVSTFSLPLEPLRDIDAFTLTNDMGADYIKWMDPSTHVWVQHDLADPIGVDNSRLYVGEGYEVKFTSDKSYTFCGMPGAMIKYDDNLFSGFDPDTDAKDLSIFVWASGAVTLSWPEPAGMSSGDWYEVYYSYSRDGFFGTLGIDYFGMPKIDYGTSTTTIAGIGARDAGARLYFMVVPFSSLGARGAGTYSIGIWTEEFLHQYDTIGIPLKMSNYESADWYCDNIPNAVGINFYDVATQRWVWHSTNMPEGAFDVTVEMGIGYQISTSGPTKFTFIGI